MRKFLALAAVASVLLAACAPEEPTLQGESPSPQEEACAKENLTLMESGRLTIGTDNPAFPPWFEGGTLKGSDWEINDPSTGQGFESAVAYAVADQLGFSEDEVTWVEVPFNKIFKPGSKDFDFAINQVSYKPARDQAVDFSDSYYDVNQALVSLQGTPVADAASLEDLKQYELGAPIGTTSYDYITENIQPDRDPKVYDSLNDAISALKNGQVDGVVVDLPTAFFVTAVQIPKGVIVGQFPTVGEQEYFGMVFEEGNSLRDCVNEALATLKADGTLQAIQQEWLSENVGAPVFQ
ncbi:MAG TPA: entry exclusion lipoprotein TrbK [Actinomycetota bacterium]|nr:entry exclusion lipoprotein TrbK [Actinomycetota bacterium]